MENAKSIYAATDALRRAEAIILDEKTVIFPAEFLDEKTLSGFKKHTPKLLITKARAMSLGFEVDEEALLIDAEDMDLAEIMALADATLEGPESEISAEGVEGEIYFAALNLVKFASLLPAVLIFEAKIPAEKFSLDEILDAMENFNADVIQTADAHLPLEGAEDARVISFREKNSASVHMALVIGDIKKQAAPLARIHSSCVTGDVLGSLRCDCGDQLQMAISQIVKEGAGVLIYLHQEGRGIGITNKLRAYKLQERGMDTYEANLMLGFSEDERDFSVAAAILKKLNIKNIRLLTNNPGKIEALEDSGIKIESRIPLVAKSGKHNHSYIKAKGKKAGHLF